jgi:predicted RNA-binding protein YlqC (UPF0109 family)
MSEEQTFIDEGSALIKSMAKGLVDNHENIEVQIASGSCHTIVFTLRCDKNDLGKLIGKRGRTATAMRTILGAIASKYGRRAILDIAE